MTHVLKSIFVTLILTLALNFTFGAKVIELRIDPATGKLSLSDGGTTAAGWLGGVIWVIKDAKIQSFQVIETPGNPSYIFTEDLPKVQVKTLHMKINFHIKRCDWYYTISWMGTEQQLHTYDPKIAVKPIIGYTELFLVGFMVTSIISIVFSSKWRKAKARIVTLEEQVTELKKNGLQNNIGDS